jgi:hypothetical protein
MRHEHKMGAVTNNLFSAKKGMALENPKCSVLYAGLLSFGSGPNPNVICATRPGRTRADLYLLEPE